MNKLSCWQINLHHCRAANINLVTVFQSSNRFAMIIQEPWVNKNNVRGLPSEWKVYRDSFADRPRACIATSPDMLGILLTQFTSKDCFNYGELWM